MVQKQAERPDQPVVFSPEQRGLAERIKVIDQDKRLSGEAKFQQTFSAIRDFVTKNPSQVTPEFARELSGSLSVIRAEVAKVWSEYKDFLSNNYNPYYWNKDDVVKTQGALDDIGRVFTKMDKALEMAVTNLDSYAREKSGAKTAKSILALAPAGYNFPKAGEMLEKAISAVNEFIDAAKGVDKPLETIGEVYKGVSKAKANTKIIGMVIAGTAIAVSGMWLGAALSVGVGGGAAIGAGDSIITAQTLKGIGEGQWLTPKEALYSVGVGAVTGGAGQAYRGWRAMRALRGTKAVQAGIEGAKAITETAPAAVGSISFFTNSMKSGVKALKPIISVGSKPVLSAAKSGLRGYQVVKPEETARREAERIHRAFEKKQDAYRVELGGTGGGSV